MKKVFFAVFAVILFSQIGYGQNIKVGVLVIGNGNNAIAAGFQSAISGVKTVLLLQTDEFNLSTEVMGATKYAAGKNISSGLEREFLKRMRGAKGIKDSSDVYVDQTSSNAILKVWADSTKNLTVIRSRSWLKLKRSGKGWAMELTDGRTIKAEALVNADASGKVNEALALQKAPQQWKELNYNSNLYRLSVASGYSLNKSTAHVVSLYGLLVPGQENLVTLNPDEDSFALGQAGGATAAYAAFFKTKTSLSNLKAIQGELINYKHALMPFSDVLQPDSNWKAIQFVGLSGFLKADISNGVVKFLPEKPVLTDEIRAEIKSYYYKAQIWFEDYKAKEMTVESTLDLVCRIGNKSPENTLAEVQKKWKTAYGFHRDFDLKRVVTRREFAALVNDYLKPFDVNIDPSGKVVR